MLLLSFTFGFDFSNKYEPPQQPKKQYTDPLPNPHMQYSPRQYPHGQYGKTQQQRYEEEVLDNQRKIIRQQREMQDDLEQQKRWDWINQRNR